VWVLLAFFIFAALYSTLLPQRGATGSLRATVNNTMSKMTLVYNCLWQKASQEFHLPSQGAFTGVHSYPDFIAIQPARAVL